LVKKEKPASKTTTSKAGGKAAASKSKGPERELTEEEKKEAQLRADLEHTTELFGLDKSLNEISLRTKEDYQNYIDCFYARVNIHNVTIFKARIFLGDFLQNQLKNVFFFHKVFSTLL
jgi:hypothetical protein